MFVYNTYSLDKKTPLNLFNWNITANLDVGFTTPIVSVYFQLNTDFYNEIFQNGKKFTYVSQSMSFIIKMWSSKDLRNIVNLKIDQRRKSLSDYQKSFPPKNNQPNLTTQ